MSLGRRLRRRRKDTRFIVGVLFALLVVFTAAFYFLQVSSDLPANLVTDRVLLFALWYANVVLILTILFVLLRNVFKLLVEHQNRILGSKFKIKMVASFVGLSLIPGLLLFAISSQLLRGSIDRWFSTPTDQVLPDARAIADGLIDEAGATLVREARQAFAGFENLAIDQPDRRPILNRRLLRWRETLELDYLAVYRGTELVQAVVSNQSSLSDLPEPRRAFLEATILEGSNSKPEETGTSGSLLLGAVSPGPESGERPLVVVAGRVLEPRLAVPWRRVIQADQSRSQLEIQKDDLATSNLLLFLMMTLLILLASSWVGLYLARRVTVPIQALADGTRRVAGGDLDYRVEVEADDEIGMLVGSFNSMTGELQASKEARERGNRELEATNLRLDRERALISAVVESVAAGVVSVSSDGRILTCNRAALELLHQAEDEVIGRPVTEAWADEERAKLASLLTESAPGPVRSSREIHLALGEWKTFEVTLSPMGDESGEGGTVMVLEDLTELIKAEQLAAWREAARRVAHEIKNPLTPIKLAAERILNKQRRGDADFEEKLEEGVGVIVREVGVLQAMVDEFSRFARMPRPRPSRIDLSELFDETAELYREVKPGVEIAIRVADDAREAWVDREQIKRALVNLLDNAVEATDAPGSVQLEASRSAGHLRLVVADTGRGIPDRDKEKLFQPYFSTKGRGTGLGLAIVHRIVADHHGVIQVEDNRPQGAVFRIELPLE